jgi:hypothetical protein
MTTPSGAMRSRTDAPPLCKVARMKVTMLLADYAQVAEGKLNVIGGGWNVTGPTPAPSSIAILIEVPWDRSNERHSFHLELVDADGHPVMATDPQGQSVPVQLGGMFEVGRPPGIKRGTPLTFPLAINLGPQPVPPGGRFEWRLTINGESDEDWRLAFSTRPEEPG